MAYGAGWAGVPPRAAACGLAEAAMEEDVQPADRHGPQRCGPQESTGGRQSALQLGECCLFVCVWGGGEDACAAREARVCASVALVALVAPTALVVWEPIPPPSPPPQTGSGYHVYDNGLSPEACEVDSSLRRDLGFIGFEYDAMGPGKLVVTVPRVTPAGAVSVFAPRREEDGTEALHGGTDNRRVMVLRNKVRPVARLA
jgi:hypothetical protein